MVTNPVDVLTYAALKFSGLPEQRVSAAGRCWTQPRFRDLIAQQARRRRAERPRLHRRRARRLGVPLWSSATIGACRCTTVGAGRATLDAEAARIAQNVVNAADQIIRGKGATNYAIGLADARIIEAILQDENRVLPVSRCSTAFTGTPTSACRCRRWSTAPGSGPCSPHASPTRSRPR